MTPAGARPRVLIISYSPLYRDARVLRQIRLLKDRYEVSTVGYGEAPEGVASHLRIPDEIVYWHKDRRLLLARAYQRTYDTMPVQRWLRGRLPVGEHDVVLANDVDTVPLAIQLKPRRGVHADLHEYASRQNEESLPWRLVVAPYFRWLVRTWVRRADSVTTVSPGLASEYWREFGIDTRLVMNAPSLIDLAPTPVGNPIRLVHAGNGVPERLETMLTAMDSVTSGATLDLYLIDQGTGYVSSLRDRYADSDRVRIHEPVPTDAIVRTLNDYDLGVYVLPPISFNFRHALPNKFFDFVQARLGLVIGPSPDMAALVREHGLGVVTTDFTAEALAAAIDALTPERAAELKAASDAASTTLCAERQVTGWNDAVEALLRGS
ncbi:glycosyltransferase family 1 protein [Pseudactinotalea terrae]|uniref:glycosyltransferase family 1 protein n=1 Tax=Pseudactinotalea terrae TaxID=1743262 RepID=UPI0012E269C3|nr:glycosyltransferase family 1 protein [Pseudactinotalea terrae]